MNETNINNMSFVEQLLRDNEKLINTLTQSSTFVKMVEYFVNEWNLDDLYLYSYTLRNKILSEVSKQEINKASKLLFAMLLAIKKLENSKIKHEHI